MRPLLTYRPLKDFPRKRREELCLCGVPCTNVVLIVQNDFTYQVCEKGTAEFGYQLLKLAGQISNPTSYSGGAVWTISEIMELKDYVKGFPGKLPYGALRAFAEHTGKTREQVKAKVTYLKHLGELPYLHPRADG